MRRKSGLCIQIQTFCDGTIFNAYDTFRVLAQYANCISKFSYLNIKCIVAQGHKHMGSILNWENEIF